MWVQHVILPFYVIVAASVTFVCFVSICFSALLKMNVYTTPNLVLLDDRKKTILPIN